ncbi:MAG: SpoIIIAH-like family protein [Clostridia bacterium]|nr:SpoIIIAH-like family protein [Clostridia bacterium]
MKTEKIKKFFARKSTRSVVVIVAVLLIGLAVYLNYRWFYDPIGSLGYGDNNMEDTLGGSQQTGGETEGDEANDYFTSTALIRQQSRDEAIDVLMLITENEEASEAAKAEAANKISKIAVDIQNEANIESLVKAKGFEDCIAVIADGSVSVVVRADSLQAKDAAQIFTIVYETTGITPENVSIINK